MTCCLITGARGFIATAASQYLQDQGRSVVLASRSPAKGEIAFTPQDLTQAFQTHDITEVIHLAARKDRSDTSVQLTQDLVHANVEATLALAGICATKSNFRRFVFMGTCDEYGASPSPYHETNRETPISAYGASKLLATHSLQMLARSCAFPAVIARPSLVYGPGQTGTMFIPSLLSCLAKGQPFHMSHGQQMRDFLYIGDLLAGLEKMLDLPGIEGQIFNLAAGQSHSLNEVVDLALDLSNSTAQQIVRATQYARRNDTTHYRVDVTTARDHLAWTAQTPLQQGLAKTLRWIADNENSLPF